MAETKSVLAFDFGASSGRAILGTFDGEQIQLKEVHRFSNDPVIVGDTMYWDTLRLFYEIKQGILKAKHVGKFESIAIDTWGVDFGLLDKDGRLLENCVHYRDTRTKGLVEESFKRIPKDTFYKITGNQFMELNTVFQLYSLVKDRPDLLDRADSLLLMPDLFNYLLTGEKKTEYSMASTTQMLDAKNRTWSKEVLKALGIPERILGTVVPSGTIVGKLSPAICEELGVDPVDVIAVCGHDTQSAMAATPTEQEDFIFISCGTWSLFGTELEQCLIDDNSEKYNITNEGGYGGKASFLKNIIGLWLIQESRRQWMREGEEYGFGELEQMASKEGKPFQCFIDPDAEVFVPAGNVPRRIRDYCRSTNQPVPESKAEIVRCINESLAMKYRIAFEEIKACTGKEYEAIHIIGGGVQSKLLCQMVANSCHTKVIAGPVEATALGNISLQFVAKGVIEDIKAVRKIIAQSDDICTYEPQDEVLWDEAFEKFKTIIL